MFKTLIALLLLSANVYAETNISQQLAQDAKAYIKEVDIVSTDVKVEYQSYNIDPRTHIVPCPSGYDFSIPTKVVRSNTTVLILCKDDPNWRLYVPVRKSELYPTLVLNRPIAQGERITANDITLAYFDQNKLRGDYIKEANKLVGARSKRKLNSGDLIRSRDICIVCKDDIVNIEANMGGLIVSTEGRALSDGVIGDNIRVENSRSQRIVNGIISAVGQIRVNL